MILCTSLSFPHNRLFKNVGCLKANMSWSFQGENAEAFEKLVAANGNGVLFGSSDEYESDEITDSSKEQELNGKL